ncbi:MAG: hypothetical protein IJN92_04935 [Lachnospiraceae bacterium]|nr:hypothetical protein [Lachnospiraceae bacterium]
MNQRITIEKPYITSNLKHARLNCNIRYPKEDGTQGEFLLHYEVPAKYKKYLVTERADTFLVAVLPQAMLHGWDIESVAPISERLYFQLTTMQMPAIDNYMEQWQAVEIFAPLSHTRLSSKEKRGLAFSAGVDAFYSMKITTETQAKNYHPEYLVFLKVGGTGSVGGEKEEKMYQIRVKRIRKFAKEYNYKLLEITSNLTEFLEEKNVHSHTYRSTSAILAVQKLFGVFYYSSGMELTEFSISHRFCGAYDLLTLQSLSTENTQFYSTGLAASRIQKVYGIAEYEPSYKYLDSCLNRRQSNCTCEKCIRTRLELYSMGILEKYSQVYDMEVFKNTFKDQTDYMVDKTTRGGKKSTYRAIYKSFKQKGLSFDEYQPLEVREKLEAENADKVLDEELFPWIAAKKSK